jgi:hypothetical protein
VRLHQRRTGEHAANLVLHLIAGASTADEDPSGDPTTRQLESPELVIRRSSTLRIPPPRAAGATVPAADDRLGTDEAN